MAAGVGCRLLLASDARLGSGQLDRLTAEVMELRDSLIIQLSVAQPESDHAVTVE